VLIRRVTLQSFGRLTGTFRFEPERCNVVCERNEAGKSTLVDAILYSFYPPQRDRRGRRGQLHPLDKYAPWGGNGSYRVELELEERGGRRLLLVNEFGNTPRTTLTDLRTNAAIALDRQTFGERFFRMSQGSFLNCFFLRQDERDFLQWQDERDNPGLGELVQVIERAAVSDRRREDAPVRAALEALGTPTLQLDEFSPNALQIETLLRRVGERLREERAKLDQLEAERMRCAQAIAAAEGLDAEIEKLADSLVRAEYECLAAEVAEAQAELERDVRLAESQAAREQRLAELQPFAGVDFSRREEARRLHAEWQAQMERAAAARRRLEEEVEPAVRAAADGLAPYPAGLRAAASRAAVERLRAAAARLGAARDKVTRQREQSEALRASMAAQGMPLDTYHALIEKLDRLPEADRQLLLTYHQRKADLETQAADASRRAAEAGARAVASRAEQERLHGRANMLLAGVLAGVIAAAGLLVMGAVWAYVLAGVVLLAGVVAGGLGLRERQQARQVEAQQREPARQEELAASAEASRQRERLASLRSEAEETLQRHGLDSACLEHLRDLGPWARQAGEYQAALQALEQAEAEASQLAEEVCAMARPAVPDLTPDKLDNAVVERALRDMERCVEGSEALSRLEAEALRVREELASAESAAEQRRAALEALIGKPSGPSTLSDAVAEFERACDCAAEYERLAGEKPLGEALGAERRAALEQVAAAASARMGEMLAQDATLAEIRPSASRAELQARLDALKARLHELRLNRVNTFNEADRVIEQWRRDGPGHLAEIARLESLREMLTEFQEAAKLAHQELAVISEQVFSQWAAAIERGVREALSQITDRYTEATVSENLRVSVFSREAERRLAARELMHLSTGARAQVMLAVRVAASEYLSEHCGPLPMAFDEPFAHWDDERFVAGMRFLTALATRHQVLVLSCHGWRFERLAQADPGLAQSLHFARPE
jgi:DNA repair exonuclease SbcCD ATPase subunit